MAKPNKESQKTTRERAAAARAKADAEQRRRDNRSRLIGGGVVVILIALIFGGVWLSKRDNGTDPSNANAALPAGVDAATYGVPYGTGSADVPQLQLWEDFQCPGCKALEDANGTGITKLADQGTIRLLWRPTTFLDTNLKNDSSARAAAAWGCAIDAGKAHEYHTTVFANQPEEGVGYTDDQLLQFGKDAGITGPEYDTFASCVGASTYAGWAANSYQAFLTEAVPGTPTGYLVLGDKKQELPSEVLRDQAKLEQAIKDFQAS
ncbi:MAG TPA: thioredoxin domain-containing protein [Candidatus Nanopelagicales bacterium]|jgi:protein-disulfide isomerase|nr:thioredoxin domain-containing protein [Candidatus Nanopelagicales bacterium]